MTPPAAPQPVPEPTLTLSMQIDGQHFSAAGPRSDVLRLYAEWLDYAGLAREQTTIRYTVTPTAGSTFQNAPRLAVRK